jgi:aspartokinase
MNSGQQIEFEKPRGISRVDVRSGFAQVQISGLPNPLAECRLAALKAVAEAGIGIDFLKLTQSGLSFMIAESQSGLAEKALAKAGIRSEIHRGRSVVLIHAVNLRDEEGLLAKLVSQAVGSGVEIEHLSDMHDRLLLVTGEEDAARLADQFRAPGSGTAS